MKQCIITNHRGGYINETIILKSLLRTLQLTKEDIFYISNENSVYEINETYTHALILLDYKITTIYHIKEYLKQLHLPKIFIADTVPEIHRQLDKEFCKLLLNLDRISLTSIPLEQFKFLYEEFADGIITYNRQDIDLLQSVYKFNRQIPVKIIPPSLGKEQDIKIDFTKLCPNKSIGFNGSPSYANGLFTLYQVLQHLSHYSFNIYGSHGRSDLSNQALTNFLTGENKLINFKGKLKNKTKFHQDNYIYYGNAKYNSFDYSIFTSILNGTIPIISIHTGAAEYLPDYPFTTDGTPQSLIKVINLIESLEDKQIREVMNKAVINLKYLNDNTLKGIYNNFLNQISNE